MLHEVFGVNDTMKAQCDALAAHGFLAVCPDLFWRIAPGVALDDANPADRTRAQALYDAFDVERGVDDVIAVVAAIRQETLGAEGVGVVGYCLGGLLAVLVALRTRIDAAVSYYGVGIEDRLDELDGLATPLMLDIAGRDRFVPPAAQERIVARLGPDPCVTIHRYPARDHAFARPGGANFHAEDAATADARTLAFLERLC